MADIHNVKLEILRPGPAHNQLLSPLTSYLALCGADGPVSVHLPFEHHQLLIRLERLRYYAEGSPIPASQRETELQELGEIIGEMFGEIPALLAELGSVRADRNKLVHLRLSLSAFELGLLPFETAIAPDGFPGSGSPLLLQANTPIALTREVRRGQPLPLEWNRAPRILFIFASPVGLAAVPADRHLIALRRAIDPWVEIKESEEERLVEVKKMLTVLPQATLEQIRQVCMDNEYTHVHILAHGAPYEHAGDQRYGLALCSSADPSKVDVVDGERLAIALTTDRASVCGARHRPTVLSLATCDSGNIKSVLTPGGSIAHELHAAGIPWVFASQFPLWMRSSTIFAEILYKRLLKGSDPRCVLHELRQRLRTSCPETHDWASIVAYATVPWNFDKQVNDFHDSQTRKQIEIKFARIDDLLNGLPGDSGAKERSKDLLPALCSEIRGELQSWREETVAQRSGKELAERLGVSAASEKRIGIAYATLQEKEKSVDAYQKSCEFYRKAIAAESSNHWVITQYLSMLAVSRCAAGKETDMLKDYRHWWATAKQLSLWQLPAAVGENRAWAYGTLAELELLGILYGGEKYEEEKSEENIRGYCKEILAICGADEFPVQSTVRQFRRYAEIWHNKKWESMAGAALAALGADQ